MSKNPENQWKLTKIVDIDGEILHDDLMNFNDFFRKDVTYVTYDNIKSQGGGGRGQTEPPSRFSVS